MTVNDSKRFHFLMHEIDARINQETMDRYGIERQFLNWYVIQKKKQSL